MRQETELLLSRLQTRLDRLAILTGDAIGPHYSDDLSNYGSCQPELVLRPRTVEDTIFILKTCNELCHPLVTQGGRTGLSGAARVQEGEAVLSLERMTAMSPVDPTVPSTIVEAGAPLQAVQEYAQEAGFIFAVDIGARGSATIGGVISTNAGGIRVLRYGNVRAHLLGVEAVLADGSVLSSLKGLAKDNSGYDLSQLFVGSEGTLGVVTRACLRLHPLPFTQSVAFCSVPSCTAAIKLLQFLRARLGTLLSAFEVILDPMMRDMVAALGVQAPVPLTSPFYVLTDIQGTMPATDAAFFAETLEQAIETGLVSDAVLSQSERDYHALWELRDACSAYVLSLGSIVNLDVSLPLTRIETFLLQAQQALELVDPQARSYVFGHLGDGNLHVCTTANQPDLAVKSVLDCVARNGGSISAEHGIGLNKKPYLSLTRNAADIGAMRRIKAALDPNAILNPGRIFDISPNGFRTAV